MSNLFVAEKEVIHGRGKNEIPESGRYQETINDQSPQVVATKEVAAEEGSVDESTIDADGFTLILGEWRVNNHGNFRRVPGLPQKAVYQAGTRNVKNVGRIWTRRKTKERLGIMS